MIKKNIQAAILTNQKSDLMLIHDLKVVELTDYQIFIKILYTGICKSQLMEIDGLRGHDPWLPHCLGLHQGLVCTMGFMVGLYRETSLHSGIEEQINSMTILQYIRIATRRIVCTVRFL